MLGSGGNRCEAEGASHTLRSAIRKQGTCEEESGEAAAVAGRVSFCDSAFFADDGVFVPTGSATTGFGSGVCSFEEGTVLAGSWESSASCALAPSGARLHVANPSRDRATHDYFAVDHHHHSFLICAHFQKMVCVPTEV